ncbi:thiaminase II [Phyllobacterium leguminum]|uniref:Aminopyrimidine aminohydrolase n=1 Tax=Phyllobacterium leguminum TaxID=314237 RepID=A0A318T1I6_9HYPH|nr:thiaminase II [Phyllobacterium leguminum]PYE87597.1 thiaminase/transcriptional activator TenA [Phyllobacterium leguminum]
MSLPQPHFSSELFTALRAATLDDWKPYIEHEFVARLGDGTLPKTAFLHYLKQDYVYLHHYARAWALGVVKAATLQETRFCAYIMHGLAHMELPLHVRLCAREGIGEDELFNIREEPENLAYTRYVLDCGQTGDFLDLLTALIPCAHGYGEIGLDLAATATSGTPYQEWIDTYAGADYQGMCHTVGKLFDRAAKDRIGEDFEKSPRWPRLCQIFATASRLEAGFWQMGLKAA